MSDLRGETMEHQQWRDLCAAHALGALDPPESARLEAHLRGCAACREEIASHQAVVEALGRSLPPMVPPAAAEQAVMKLAVESRGREESPPFSPRPATATAGGLVSRWLLPVAAMLVAGASLWLAADASNDVEELVSENRILHDLVERAHESDVVAYALVTTSRDLRADGWVFFDHNDREDPEDDVLTIHGEGLEPAPEGSSYQAWAIGGARVRRLGALDPDESGYHVKNIALPDLSEIETIQVTLESSDVSAPTGKVMFRSRTKLRLIPTSDAP